MIADRTAAVSSLSRAAWRSWFTDGETALDNSSPLDEPLAVPLDVEGRDLVFAVDIGQGFDRRPETADPGASQVADGKSLFDERLAALEGHAIGDGAAQMEGVDLDQLEEVRVPEQAPGDADLDVVLHGLPDRAGLLDLHAVLVPEKVEIILDGMLVGPGAEDKRPRAVEVPCRLLQCAHT